MDDAAFVTAWATVAIAFVTGGGVAATCFLIWRGIVEMRRSSDQRAKDREARERADHRRHQETMDESLRRHNEAMDEGRRRHDEAMAALRALIERTAPAPAGRAGEAD